MTPELTARTVKVCKVIGWPKMSLMPNDNDSWELVLSWDVKLIDYEIEYALESHFRQWLIQKYGYLNFRFEKNWISLTTMGKRGALKLKLETHDDDYLDLLLTAVERTLEQENAKCDK